VLRYVLRYKFGKSQKPPKINFRTHLVMYLDDISKISKMTWFDKYKQNSQSRPYFSSSPPYLLNILLLFASGFAGCVRRQGLLRFISFWFTCAGRIDKWHVYIID
jgi:hypothetical protein